MDKFPMLTWKLKIKTTCFIIALLLLPTLSFAEQGNEYTSFFGFTLNKGTLADIQEKLGKAPLIEKGDAGEYEASICYVVPSGYTISFLSGELGGNNHKFLGYSVRKISENDNCNNCLLINSLESKRFKPQIGKLRIGMTKKEFIKSFGKKINWLNENRGMISFESRRKMTTRELQKLTEKWPVVSEYPYFDIVISLTGKFSEGVMDAFIVWKTETN